MITAAIITLPAVIFSQTLQYNGTKLISSTQDTVPANKVWKVESIFGQGSVCYPYYNENFGTIRYALGQGAGFVVNGTTVVSDAVKAYNYHYSDNICTQNPSTNWNPTNPEWKSSYNILPMWLPSAAILKTTSSTVFLSVIEFNIVP